MENLEPIHHAQQQQQQQQQPAQRESYDSMHHQPQPTATHQMPVESYDSMHHQHQMPVTHQMPESYDPMHHQAHPQHQQPAAHQMPESYDSMQLQQPAAHQMPVPVYQTPADISAPSSGSHQPMSANYPLPDNCTVQDIKLFVGKIPNECTEQEILPLFEAWGTVLECVIIRDKTSTRSKGSAFVRMKRLCDADAAIKELHNRKKLGNDVLGPMQVKYAVGEAERIGLSEQSANPGVDEAKLFVGSLPRTATEEDLKSQFSGFGEINEVFLIRDSNTGQGKGCAFVKFGYKECGLWACRTLNGNVTFPGFTRPLEVRFAESKRMQTSPGQMLQPQGTAMAAPMYGSPMTTGIAAGMGGAVAQSAIVGSSVPAPSNTNPRVAGPWKEYFNEQNRPYYHNSENGQTTWDIPIEFQHIEQQAMPHQPLAGHPSASLPRTDATVPPAAQDVAGPPGANVFIFHVPNEWTQQELLRAFTPWGNIVSARVAIDKVTQRNKGYAFVSYDNINSAAQAVSNMNGYMAGTKRLKVSIKQGEEQYVAHLTGAGGTPAPGPGGAARQQATGYSAPARNPY